MKVYKLIRILANVCKYNAEGEVFMRLPDGSLTKFDCLDDLRTDHRALIFVPKDEK